MATGNGSKQLRRYSLRTERGAWLAEVVISDDGYFSTVSDYGSYAYFWSHAGCEFRGFLARLDADYLVGKIKPGYVYDGAATLKSVKRRICEDRRSLDLTAEEAREEWDLLGEHGDLDESESFALWMNETKLEDVWEISRSKRDPQAMAFAEQVWPVFAAALRAEVAAEQKTVMA
jgi:hypothetical protein